MTYESGGSGEEEKEGAVQDARPVQTSEDLTPAPETAMPAPSPPPTGGKRTQLKIVRENIEALSKDMKSFRKSHEVSAKKLEADIATVRKDIAASAHLKDLGSKFKSHEVSSKRL